MCPLLATAAILVPSLDDVTPFQSFLLPTDVSLVQLTPESVDIQMSPETYSTAHSLVPSLDEVTLRHFFKGVCDTDVSWIQVLPESVDLQMCPWYATATIWVPSLEEVIP